MKKVFLILAILLLGKSGFAQQKIPQDDILFALEEGNYEVQYCAYVRAHIHDSLPLVKVVELNITNGIFKTIKIISNSFSKESEMCFASVSLFRDDGKIERTKEKLLKERCHKAIVRFNQVLQTTTKKTYYQ